MTVGWCIEWLQAFFLVADDMMDHSITRRGQPCWYKVPKVGLNACNDCIVLEACIYKILKKHVKKLPCYLPVRPRDASRFVHASTADAPRACALTRSQILELFHDVTYQTSCGQLIDLITAPIGQARGLEMIACRAHFLTVSAYRWTCRSTRLRRTCAL